MECVRCVVREGMMNMWSNLDPGRVRDGRRGGLANWKRDQGTERDYVMEYVPLTTMMISRPTVHSGSRWLLAGKRSGGRASWAGVASCGRWRVSGVQGTDGDGLYSRVRVRC